MRTLFVGAFCILLASLLTSNARAAAPPPTACQIPAVTATLDDGPVFHPTVLRNVLIAPTSVTPQVGNPSIPITGVTVALPAGWKAVGKAPPADTSVDVKFNGSAIVPFQISGPSCTATFVALQVPLLAAPTITYDATAHAIRASLSESIGFLYLTLDSTSAGTPDAFNELKLSYFSGSADNYYLRASASVTFNGSAAPVLGAGTVALYDGATPLTPNVPWTTSFGHLGACQIVQDIASAWKPQSLTINGATKLTFVSFTKDTVSCDPTLPLAGLAATVQLANSPLSPAPIAFNLDFSNAATSFELTMQAGSTITVGSNLKITFSKLELILGGSPAGPQLLVSATLSGTIAGKALTQTGDPFSALLSDQGLTFDGSTGAGTTISYDQLAATITNFGCKIIYNPLGFGSCTATASLAFSSLAAPIEVVISDTSVNVSSSTVHISLNNGYTINLTGAALSTGNPVQLTIAGVTAKATISGGLLGASGITISGLKISAAGVCGTLNAPPSFTAGPITLSNFTAKFYDADGKDDTKNATSCTTAAKQLTLTGNVEVSVNQTATTPAPDFSLGLGITGFNLSVPFNGPIVMQQPTSINFTGTFFGRKIVGVCPSDLTQTTALPPAAAGTATASYRTDVVDTNIPFQILADGNYQICVGIHITPNPMQTGTSDLVDAQLLLDSKRLVPISGRISFNGGSSSTITTQLGTRMLTVNSLDLSYDSTAKGTPSTYVTDQSIPMGCAAEISGNGTFSIANLIAAGSTTTSLSTQIGIGSGCFYSDISGTLTIPVTQSVSITLNELHFGYGPWATPPTMKKPPDPVPTKPVWYTRSTFQVGIGNGGVAFDDTGVEDDGTGYPRPRGHVDGWKTFGMNIQPILSGIAGFIGGLVVK